MTILETTQYARTKKKIIKKFILTEQEIDTTLTLFKEHQNDPALHYKKMTCKKDKNRYSIRILGTSYRILMTVLNNEAILACVCDHDDYDMRNKGC
jgi:mRNA-degrading endonuclease RelE of RelBE toxin-antitoxin system